MYIHSQLNVLCVYCRHIADPEIIEEGSPVRRRRHVESDEEEKSSEDEEEIDEEVHMCVVRTHTHTYVRTYVCVYVRM